MVSSISGNCLSTASTSRTLVSVNSRLVPTGVLSRSEMKLSSTCGCSSLPISGSSAKLEQKIRNAVHSTMPRLLIFAQRGRASLQSPVRAAIHRVDPFDDALDAVHEASQPGHALEARGRRIVPDRREHRIEREAYEQRHQHGGRHRQAELEEELAAQA